MIINISTIFLYFNLLILFSIGCILPFMSSDDTIFGVKVDESFDSEINFTKLYFKHYIISSIFLLTLSFITFSKYPNANLFILFTILIVFNICVNYLIINHRVMMLFNASQLNNHNTIIQSNSTLWKLGVFYYNPEDPSIFIPKRSGNGLVLNWAKKTTWMIIIVPLIPIFLILFI